MNSKEDKVLMAVEWFNSATPVQKEKAVRALFEHAILSEWIGVWSVEDCKELAGESGGSVDYTIPYFTTCGEPICGRDV